METLNIPEGVTILDGCVFLVAKIKNIQIPNKVILLEIRLSTIATSSTTSNSCQCNGYRPCFCGSNNLEYISIDDKNKTFSDIDGIIYDKDKVTNSISMREKVFSLRLEMSKKLAAMRLKGPNVESHIFRCF